MTKADARGWQDEYRWMELWEEAAVLDVLAGYNPDAAVRRGEMAERREAGRRRAKKHVDAAIAAGELIVVWKVDPSVEEVLSHPKVRKVLEAVNPGIARQLRDDATARRLYAARYAVRPVILAAWVARTPGRFPAFQFSVDDFARADASAGEPLRRAMSVEASGPEAQRRANMLTAYKAATGLKDADIYNAAGLAHKTDFYKWKKGTLPSRSATARTLEWFLDAKRPPAAKKPTPASRRRAPGSS